MRNTLTKSVMKVSVLILAPLILLGLWLWNIQRSWSFVQAAGRGNVREVRAGLDSGIDPNRATMKGATAMMFAANCRRPGQEEVVRLLLARGADPNDGMSSAAASGKVDVVRLLLDRGADPNRGLFSAVNSEQVDLVRLLIAKGANVNPRGCCDGVSLLQYAAQSWDRKKSNQIVRLLKAAGAKK